MNENDINIMSNSLPLIKFYHGWATSPRTLENMIAPLSREQKSFTSIPLPITCVFEIVRLCDIF